MAESAPTSHPSDHVANGRLARGLPVASSVLIWRYLSKMQSVRIVPSDNRHSIASRPIARERSPIWLWVVGRGWEAAVFTIPIR
jgi:hypothetical protein